MATILMALAATILAGAAALAVDFGYWQYVEAQMQGAADQAAYSAAVASTLNGANPTTNAQGITAQMGFVNGANSVTVAVNNPPSQGSYTSNNSAWEVIISQPQPLWFANFLLSTSPTVSARAVAIPNQSTRGSGTACILALNTTAADAVSLAQNADVTSTSCGIASNSDSLSSLALANNATIDAPLNVVGQWSLANGASISGSPQNEDAAAVTNPYANTATPSPGTCTSQSGSGKNNVNVNLTPGYFCNGWDFGNNATITLAAGTYYIAQGITIGNNGTLDGTSGVTIVMTDSTPLDIGNNAAINLTAPGPSSGQPYIGMAMVGLTTATGPMTFSNNTQLNVTGAIYFPNDAISFSNNTQASSAGCTQIIGNTISLSNNVTIDDSQCTASVGATPIKFGGSPLVEE